MPYSEFKTLFKDNRIAERDHQRSVDPGHAQAGGRGRSEPVRRFTTTRVEDPKLTEELEARGVEYTGEVVNRWVAELLSSIIPSSSSSRSGGSSSAG